jgi:hypothetical protein
MGQYGNQPDFGTRTRMIVPEGNLSNPAQPGQKLNSAALYVGKTGDLLVTVVGGEGNSEYDGATLFKSVPVGFFPVIVDNVWRYFGEDIEITTASDIVAIY